MWIFGLINSVVFTVSIITLLVAIAPSARAGAGRLLVILSYAYGVSLFVAGFLVTLEIWGWLGVIVGLFLAGIGVAPVGIIAALVTGAWGAFWTLVVLAVLTFGTRIIGLLIAENGENQNYKPARDVIGIDDTNTEERAWKDLM